MPLQTRSGRPPAGWATPCPCCSPSEHAARASRLGRPPHLRPSAGRQPACMGTLRRPNAWINLRRSGSVNFAARSSLLVRHWQLPPERIHVRCHSVSRGGRDNERGEGPMRFFFGVEMGKEGSGKIVVNILKFGGTLGRGDAGLRLEPHEASFCWLVAPPLVWKP